MRVSSNTIRRIALATAGIDNFRLRNLQHIWASWLAQAGVPVSALREMGGWKALRWYSDAHLAPNHLTGQVRRIDAIFRVSVANLSRTENLKTGEGG
ncbi:site-specific integrase [Erwinia sp. 198]|nr:site-specific integrase [Erwinia sp. 198]